MQYTDSNILIIIPARMGSSRFPGKPMAAIAGQPMIGHVYENMCRNYVTEHVWVATCDQEIASYIEGIGGRAVMTSSKHERASDRCAEATLKIEKKLNCVFDIVVLVQGDEPMTTGEMVAEAVEPMLIDSSIQITNLYGEIDTVTEWHDRNCIKVVLALNSNALYFSREPLPTGRLGAEYVKKYKQICVIPFRRDYLFHYSELPPTPLEVCESIDMLRVLEHGEAVKMVRTESKTYAVDTPEDLVRVEALMGCK